MTINMKTVAKVCRASREAYHYTQSDLATIVGQDQSIISRFEKGELLSEKLLLWYLFFFAVDPHQLLPAFEGELQKEVMNDEVI